MKRFSFFLKESPVKLLKSIDDLSLSEHIRRAIDDYIMKLRPSKESASDSKRGDKDG